MFRLDTFDPERAVTSFLYGPKVLLVTRIIGTIYTIAVLVAAFITMTSMGLFIQYFTHLTYIALSVYFMWSTIWSILYVRLPFNERSQFATQRSRGESTIYWILYQTLVVYHLLIPLVFWIALRNYQREDSDLYIWTNISQHTSDGVLMLIEMISTRTLMEIRHVIFVILFLLLYLGWTWLFYGIYSNWPYLFLDFESFGWIKVMMVYIGIPIVVTILFCLAWKVHCLKEVLGTRKEKINIISGEQKAEVPLAIDHGLPAHVQRTIA